MPLVNVPLEKLIFHTSIDNELESGSYMSDDVLLNLLNELGKTDNIRGLANVLSFFRNKFNKIPNTGAGSKNVRLYLSYDHKTTFK